MTRFLQGATLPILLLGACQGDREALVKESGPGESGSAGLLVEARAGQPCTSPGDGGFTTFDAGPDWAAIEPGSLERQTGWGLGVGDFSGDGFYDVFVPQNGQDQLFFGAAGGSLTRVTAKLPVEESWGMSVVVFDAEGDGDLDLYVGELGPNRLLLNDGTGAFAEVPGAGGAAGIDLYTQHVSAGDLDGDGLLDLYAANFPYDEQETPYPNALYRNLGGARFEDISAALTGPASEWPTNAGGWFDADRDGDQDLYVINDKESLGTNCVMLWNEGGELRPDDGAAGLNIRIDGMGQAIADLNGDEIPEIFVTGTYELTLLMSAPDGTWYDASQAMGVRAADPHVTGWGPEFADLDNDGDLDLLVAFGVAYDLSGVIATEQTAPHEQRNGLWVQLDDGTFLEDSAYWGLDSLGSYRGFVLVDWNLDGTLDFIDRDSWGRPQIHLGTCNPNSWLEVGLRAPGPNTYGVGARVEVEAGDEHQERWVWAGTTNITMGNPPEVHFGLDRAETVDRLRVIWPDGAVSELRDVPARQKLTLTRSP